MTSFHEGELAVQQRAGEQFAAERNGAIMQRTIAAGARPFLSQQNLAVFASQSGDGSMWCSIVFGRPGFLKSPDGTFVLIDLNQAVLQPADPLWANLESCPQIGMLLIDPVTRRRLRVNGNIPRPIHNTLRLDVVEAYPNCGKYITSRRILLSDLAPPSLPSQSGTGLDSAQADMLTRADLLFLASLHPERGADASHRGGAPGFITIVDTHTIRVPDYSGNSMFNTFGNLQINPRIGMALPDFERGINLQLTGEAEVKWNVDEAADSTGGTRRILEFDIERWTETPMPSGISAEFLSYSPFNPISSNNV